MTKEEFLKIVDKYLSGQASVEEEQILFNFFSSFQNGGEWDERLNSVKQDLEEKMLGRLLREVRKSSSKRSWRVSFIRPDLWRGLAAAVVIMCSFAGVFYYYRLMHAKQQSKLTAVKTKVKFDIPPGGNKAVLMLADGSSVVLDSAANGVLANQGSIAVKKIENGRLVYGTSGSRTAKGRNGRPVYNKIMTPRGGQYQLVLADGTHVWLNAESSLSFPAEFTGRTRQVELSGEAYFEVAKNSSSPFVVTTGSKRVEVLGTGFNVRAYSDEKDYETTLVKGSIKVSQDTNPGTARILKPGEQARIGSAGINLISNVDTEEITAWKDGLFMFNHTSIDEAMQQIEKWYDAQIIYEGPRPVVSLTGVIPRSNNVSRILNVLEAAGGVKFTVEGKKIIIRKNG